MSSSLRLAEGLDPIVEATASAASSVRVRIPIGSDADVDIAEEQGRRLASRLDFSPTRSPGTTPTEMTTMSLESFIADHTQDLQPENRIEHCFKSARLLGVGGDPSLFRELARYVEQSGAVLERSADEATTLQALAHGGWGAVVTGVDRDAGVPLGWGEAGLPRLAVRARMVGVTT